MPALQVEAVACGSVSIGSSGAAYRRLRLKRLHFGGKGRGQVGSVLFINIGRMILYPKLLRHCGMIYVSCQNRIKLRIVKV